MVENGEANRRDVHCRVAMVVVTVMATYNPAKIFIDSSDSSESEPTLTNGNSDDLASESESEEDNPGSSKVTEPPRDVGRAKPAAISRPRALLLNPPGQQKRKRCGPSTRLQKKSLLDCVREYPAEHLSVDAGRLFCKACRTAVSSKASSLKRHMATARHTAGKEQRVREAERQQTLSNSVANYCKTVHPSGRRCQRKRVYFQVVETFLKAGI